MIRTAEISDIEQLVEWVWIILEDMELSLLKTMDTETLKTMIKKAMESKDYRYSYQRALVCIRDGEMAGACFGYKGELEPVIDDPFNKLLSEAGIEEELFKDSETVSGEWYLDSLVTDKKFRGKGVATELLEALPTIAKAENEPFIGLNCDKGNQKAQKLYLKMGFEKVWDCKLGDHLYDHMQLKIN